MTVQTRLKWTHAVAAMAMLMQLTGAAVAAARPSAKVGVPAADQFPLPKACFNANGSFNQENIVLEQKKRAALIGEKLGVRFTVSETAHYLVFCNAGQEMTVAFREWCEPLYANLQRLLGMDPKERAWDGKCIVMLFNARQEFLNYATQFDNLDASRWSAYYVAENSSTTYPVCMHMSFAAGGRPLKPLQDLFAHEGTHAFFRTYKGNVRLPLWLEEGLGEYMMVYNDATLRPTKRAPAEAVGLSGKSIAGLFEYPSTAVLTTEEYSVCYTLVDYLFSVSGPRTRTLIEALKRKVPQDSAIQTSFGFKLADLQERWRSSLRAETAEPRRR